MTVGGCSGVLTIVETIKMGRTQTMSNQIVRTRDGQTELEAEHIVATECYRRPEKSR